MTNGYLFCPVTLYALACICGGRGHPRSQSRLQNYVKIIIRTKKRKYFLPLPVNISRGAKVMAMSVWMSDFLPGSTIICVGIVRAVGKNIKRRRRFSKRRRRFNKHRRRFSKRRRRFNPARYLRLGIVGANPPLERIKICSTHTLSCGTLHDVCLPTKTSHSDRHCQNYGYLRQRIADEGVRAPADIAKIMVI